MTPPLELVAKGWWRRRLLVVEVRVVLRAEAAAEVMGAVCCNGVVRKRAR